MLNAYANQWLVSERQHQVERINRTQWMYEKETPEIRAEEHKTSYSTHHLTVFIKRVS